MLVAVRAAGLNGADLLQVKGLYPAPPGSPQDIPGMEFAGEVVGSGRRRAVRGRRPGHGGGRRRRRRRELHRGPRAAAHARPGRVDWVAAGGSPRSSPPPTTPSSPRRSCAPGERVLIHGAAGGVGVAAVQLAHLAGARVVRHRPLRARCATRSAALGADVATAPDDFAAHGPFDVILELVGAPNLAGNLEALATRRPRRGHRHRGRRPHRDRPARADDAARPAHGVDAAGPPAGGEGPLRPPGGGGGSPRPGRRAPARAGRGDASASTRRQPPTTVSQAGDKLGKVVLEVGAGAERLIRAARWTDRPEMSCSKLETDRSADSMGMHMGMGGWGLMRSMRRDELMKQHRLTKGIVRRIAGFARPYRGALAVFLVLIVVDAVVGAVNPLLYRAIIDDGILGHNVNLVAVLAGGVAALAIFDAVLGLAQRWLSARVGEGLIFDMRTKVFAHINEMPISFFTRTQTGALISRLNNDVLGAQQAFTDTFASVVGNVIGVSITLVAMFFLSWQITLLSLVLLPVFLLPARWVGRRLAGITRESYNLNAQMNTTMSERFNVSGALLVKLFGHPEEEVRGFAAKARRVRDIGILQAMYARIFMTSLLLTASLATALVYGLGGAQAARGVLMVGTVVALTAYLSRLYGPLTALSNVQVDIMTALVSFDRVFEVLDLPPMIAEKPDAVPIPRGPATIEFDHVDFRYPSAEEVSLASLEAVAVLERTNNQQVLFDITFTAQPGQLVALVGPSGAGKTTLSHLVPAPLRRARRRGAHQRHRRPRRHPGIDPRHRRGGHPGRAPLPRDDPLQPRVRQAGRHRRGAVRGAARRPDPAAGRVASRRPRHAGRRPRLPAVRRREAAHRYRTAAAQGARHRGARRGHRAPRLGVRGGGAGGAPPRADRAHLAGDRAPPVDRARRRRHPGHRPGSHRRAGNAPQPPRRRRPVRRALPHPVREPGAWWRRVVATPASETTTV